MSPAIKFYETHPADKFYYKVKGIFVKAEDERKKKFDEAGLSRYTTKPHMEIRW